MLGLGCHGHRIQIVGEENHTWGRSVGVVRPLQEDRLAESRCEMVADSGDQGGFGGREAKVVILPVQAQKPQHCWSTISAARSSSPSPRGRMMSRYRGLDRR